MSQQLLFWKSRLPKAGEWLIVTRHASGEVYGKTQEAVAKDEAFAKLYAHTATFAELTARNVAVGVDL